MRFSQVILAAVAVAGCGGQAARPSFAVPGVADHAEAATDELGRYRLLVQPAAYVVRFESEHVQFSWQHVTAAAGSQIRLDVDLAALAPVPPRDRDATAEPHLSPRVATCSGVIDAP